MADEPPPIVSRESKPIRVTRTFNNTTVVRIFKTKAEMFRWVQMWVGLVELPMYASLVMKNAIWQLTDGGQRTAEIAITRYFAFEHVPSHLIMKIEI